MMMFKKTFAQFFAAVMLTCMLVFSVQTLSAAAAENSVSLEYQHIRNATAKITYGGKTFLIDPFLAPKGAYPGFTETLHPEMRIPLIDLPSDVQDIIAGTDAVILTHTHLDHWDTSAQMLLPKNIPFFVQNAGDARTIREQGFVNVQVTGKNTPFGDITISKTGGQHGTDEMYSIPAIAEGLGDAMGFVLQKDGLKTVYFAGDNNWNVHVDMALDTYKPEIIVLNTGYAQITAGKGGPLLSGSLIMGTDDVLHAYQALPQAQIIAVHMDAVNHTAVSSRQMRKFVKEHKLLDRISIPREGEIVRY